MTKVVIYRSAEPENFRQAVELLERLGQPRVRVDLSRDEDYGILLIIDEFRPDRVATDRLASTGKLELYDSWDERIAH